MEAADAPRARRRAICEECGRGRPPPLQKGLHVVQSGFDHWLAAWVTVAGASISGVARTTGLRLRTRLNCGVALGALVEGTTTPMVYPLVSSLPIPATASANVSPFIVVDAGNYPHATAAESSELVQSFRVHTIIVVGENYGSRYKMRLTSIIGVSYSNRVNRHAAVFQGQDITKGGMAALSMPSVINKIARL